MRSLSLRSRAVLAAVPVLVIALGLVGFAVSEANYRGAVSSLQLRMETYVYSILAAMEVDAFGGFIVEEELADPLLVQPASGLYVQVQGENEQWRSASALGVNLPGLPRVAAGRESFQEPAGDRPWFTYQLGIGWQREDGGVSPFTVSVLVAENEIGRQTRAFRSGLRRSLALAGAILVLAQLLIGFLVFRPLRRVAHDVARIESGEAERLKDHYPRELEPLARNVNRLLETEKSNQERIRNALDSLAHSLKTPLAVLQAGLPLHGGKSEASMQNALDEMQRLVATRLERAGSSARRSWATVMRWLARAWVSRFSNSVDRRITSGWSFSTVSPSATSTSVTTALISGWISTWLRASTTPLNRWVNGSVPRRAWTASTAGIRRSESAWPWGSSPQPVKTGRRPQQMSISRSFRAPARGAAGSCIMTTRRLLSR